MMRARRRLAGDSVESVRARCSKGNVEPCIATRHRRHSWRHNPQAVVLGHAPAVHVRRHAQAVDLLQPRLLVARRRRGPYVRLCRVEEALGHPVERCSASTPDQVAMARLERQDPRLNSMDGGGMWMLRSIWRGAPRRGTLSANVSGIHCSRVWVGPSSVAKTWLGGSR